MMLPNMTPESVAELEKKGFRTTPQLCQAASDNPNAVKGSLASVSGSPKEASEVMQVHMQYQANMLCVFSLNLLDHAQAVEEPIPVTGFVSMIGCTIQQCTFFIIISTLSRCDQVSAGYI